MHKIFFKNAIDICVLILDPGTSVNLLISSLFSMSSCHLAPNASQMQKWTVSGWRKREPQVSGKYQEDNGGKRAQEIKVWTPGLTANPQVLGGHLASTWNSWQIVLLD